MHRRTGQQGAELDGTATSLDVVAAGESFDDIDRKSVPTAVSAKRVPLHRMLLKAICGIDGKANTRSLSIMVFVLCMAVGVAIFQYYLARMREQSAAQQQFEQFASTFFLAVSNAWRQYETLPQMMANFVATQATPSGNLSLTNAQFQRFADPVGTFWDFTVVNHIEWVPNIEGSAARQAIEADMKSQLQLASNSSFSLFVFNTSSPSGSTPVGVRPYYYPIQFAAPCCMYDFNIGFDLGSDAIELPYIDAVRQYGKPITTHAFDLRGPKWVGYKYPKGLIMFFPVHFNSTLNKTVTSGNGDRLLGSVAPVIVIHKLWRATLADRLSLRPNMHVFLYDMTTSAAGAYLGQIAADNAPLSWPKDPSLAHVQGQADSLGGFIFNSAEHEFFMYNRRFRVVTMATADFRDAFLTFLPWALIILALLARFAINFSQAMRRESFTEELHAACCGTPAPASHVDKNSTVQVVVPPIESPTGESGV